MNNRAAWLAWFTWFLYVAFDPPRLVFAFLKSCKKGKALELHVGGIVSSTSAVAYTHPSLFFDIQSASNGLLQRQLIAPFPSRLERLFPKCLAGRNHGTLVLGALGRRERPPPILAQRGGRPIEPRCPFRPPLRDRYSGQPL